MTTVRSIIITTLKNPNRRSLIPWASIGRRNLQDYKSLRLSDSGPWQLALFALVITTGCTRPSATPDPTPVAAPQQAPADAFRKEIFSNAHRTLVSFNTNKPTSTAAIDTELKLLETAVKGEAEQNTLKALRLARDNQAAMVMLEACRVASLKASEAYDSVIQSGNKIVEEARADRKFGEALAANAERVNKQVLQTLDWQKEISDSYQSGYVCFYSPTFPGEKWDFRDKVQKAGFKTIAGNYGMYVAYDPHMKTLQGFNETLCRIAGEMINNNGKPVAK